MAVYGWAISGRLEPLKTVARMLAGRLGNVITYCRHVITNAVAEGLNSFFQTPKYAASGFRAFVNCRIRILFFYWKLDLRPRLRCH